jgi:tetraacyldisaccharide 4'-kinase
VGVGNGLLLPAGPLRETLTSGIKRSDAILIINSDNNNNSIQIIKKAKKYKKPIFFVRRELNATGFFGKYIAFAGIGYPSKFFNALRMVPAIRIVEKVSFADHYQYKKSDILHLFRMAKQYGARLICTEKDWVKLAGNIRSKVRFVPLKITIQPNFYVWLNKKIGDINAKS